MSSLLSRKGRVLSSRGIIQSTLLELFVSILCRNNELCKSILTNNSLYFYNSRFSRLIPVFLTLITDNHRSWLHISPFFCNFAVKLGSYENQQTKRPTTLHDTHGHADDTRRAGASCAESCHTRHSGAAHYDDDAIYRRFDGGQHGCRGIGGYRLDRNHDVATGQSVLGSSSGILCASEPPAGCK